MNLTAFDGRAFLLLILLVFIIWAAVAAYRNHSRTDVCVRCGHPIKPGMAYHPLCLHLERAEQNHPTK